MEIVVGEFTPTAVNDIQEADITSPQNIFSLDGRIVRHSATTTDGLPKGIYIINNRKYVVR